MNAEELQAISERMSKRQKDGIFRTFDASDEQWVASFFSDIDALIAQVERARTLLDAIRCDDKLELTDGTMDRLGEFLGTGDMT